MVRLRLILLVCIFCVAMTIPAQEEIPNQDYRVEAFVSNAMPYVGEQIIYGFRYYTYAAPEGLNERLPDFEGFWVADIYELAAGRVEMIDNLQYVVGELFAEITPLQAGSVVIKPAILEVPDTVFQQGGELSTDHVIVEVQPLPEGAPQEFSGAVGQFNAFTNLEPDRITLGQPVTLAMTIDGSGNLEQLPAPQLPDVPGWRIYPNPSRYEVSELGNLRFGQKIYEWLLIPEQTGSQTFPAVVFSFFDPQLEEYRSIASTPFTIEVFPGVDNLRSLPNYDLTSENSSQILPLKTVSLAVIQSNSRTSILLLWILPPIIFVGCAGWIYGRKLISHRQKENNKKKALQKAKHSLATLTNSAHDQASYHILATLNTFIKDKAKLPKNTSFDLVETLTAHNIDERLQQKLCKHINWIESAHFTPHGTKQDFYINELIKTLTALDKAWR